MKYIKFNDKRVDSFLFMELSDLAKTLTKNDETEVEFAVQSYFDPLMQKVYISHFWDNRPRCDMVNGLKSDVFLRSIGSYKYSDFQAINHFLSAAQKLTCSSFAKQLFVMLEDLRLEEMCKQERPGTTAVFSGRRSMYRKFFKSQLTINQERSISTDALFNAFYLKATADSPLEEFPKLTDAIDLAVPFIQSQLLNLYEAQDTEAISKIVLTICEVLEDILEKDMLNMYFHLPLLNYSEVESGLTFDDLKRKSKLKNDDILEQEKEDDEDIHEDKLPTWHRETSEATKSFLQFDLEQGSKTNLLGEGVREGDDGDQALGMVQGSSKKTARNDYSKLEAMENAENKQERGDSEAFGKENKYAYPVFVSPDNPSPSDQNAYTEKKEIIAPFQKKLKQMIEKTLEHKKISPRSDLHTGRLSKKLLKFLTEENPRLFYKKNQPSAQIDAAFCLLVDCSASMFDKMEQTKLGITLFHEALKSVAVVHQVVGFWEDTNEATETKQPNHFKTVIDFPSSLQKKRGPEILQLQPEEDNRDGYAIRHMTKQLLSRTETQKFLLVFSDGEPAAAGYEQNGIIDTHEAVIEARKRGIEVINIFLANGEIDEGQQKTIQNIYGKFSIVVPDIEKLPEVLFPILKKLLQKSIHA